MTSIEVIKNDKLKLPIPEFSCDGGINDNLNNYPMLRNLNAYKTTAIVGKPGSGKTSLLVSWLSSKGKKTIFRKVFHHVYVVMPSSSRQSMKKNVFKNHPEEKMFDELSLETITTIHNNLLHNTEEKEKSLLILDDVGAAMKNKEIQKILRLIMYNRRHLKVAIVVLLQSYLSVPKEVRKMFSSIVCFKPSLVEMDNLCNEMFEMQKETTIDLMKFAYKNPHDYLFLNVDEQRIFRDYDEIIVKTKEDDDLESNQT